VWKTAKYRGGAKASGLPDYTQTTVVGRLETDEQAAHRVADLVAETYQAEEAAACVVDEGQGRWSLALHFRSPPDEAALRALVGLAAGREAAEALCLEHLPARDWVKASLAALSPVVAGRFVVHGAHDRVRVAANRIGIEIEAALAFGTGHHGTTRGCLVALDCLLRACQPRRILDLGTGSGVLAIAAARALQRRVLATDIDPAAVRAARGNARLNRCGALVQVVHADGLAARPIGERAPFDLVFANILLNPLKRMAAPLKRRVAPGARIVLSGLLPRQANAALSAYRGLALDRRIAIDGWTTLILARRAAKRMAPDARRPGRTMRGGQKAQRPKGG
jgi:ribosomal protein L11 methyltransferase